LTSLFSQSIIIIKMNKKQRESTAKYLYDISKGIVLLAVISNLVQEKWNILSLILGVIAAIAFFLWGYYIEGGIRDE